MSWWRRNWRWMLAIFISVIGGIVIAILYALRKKAEVENLQAEVALMRAGAKVEGLQADKKARKKQLEQNTVERDKLDSEIRKAKKKAVSTVKDVEGMSDFSIAVEFKKLGY